MDAPPGVPGVSKNQIFLQIKLLSSCAKIDPKLQKLQKTFKIEKKVVKKPCFLSLFQIFLNLGSILALQIIKILLRGFIRILIFLYDSSTLRIFFFIILKLKPDVTFIDLTCIKVTISLFIARMAGFSK